MNKADPTNLYLGLIFCNSLFFGMIFVVASLYEATLARLTGLQLVLVFTPFVQSIETHGSTWAIYLKKAFLQYAPGLP